ncbi:unnamed protein product, partial [Urochloa humidicola]
GNDDAAEHEDISEREREREPEVRGAGAAIVITIVFREPRKESEEVAAKPLPPLRRRP